MALKRSRKTKAPNELYVFANAIRHVLGFDDLPFSMPDARFTKEGKWIPEDERVAGVHVYGWDDVHNLPSAGARRFGAYA